MDLADGGQIIIGKMVYGNLYQHEDYLNKFRQFEAEIKHDEKIQVYQYIGEGHRGLNIDTPIKFRKKVIERAVESEGAQTIASGNLNFVFKPELGHPFAQADPDGPTVYRVGIESDREVEKATLVVNDVNLDGVLHSNLHLRPMHDRNPEGTKRVRLSASKIEYWDVISQDESGVYLNHIEPIGIKPIPIGMNEFEVMASSGNAPPVTKIATVIVDKNNSVSSFTLRDGRISGTPRPSPIRLVESSSDFTDRTDIQHKRKVRCELQNVSGLIVRVRVIDWIPGEPGVEARVVAGTLQLKTSSGWDPASHGVAELLVPQSKNFRLWIGLKDETLTVEQIKPLLDQTGWALCYF